MGSVPILLFSILFVLIIGTIVYFTIDYLTYKEDMNAKTEQRDLTIKNLGIDANNITSNLNQIDKTLSKKHNEDSSDLNSFDKAIKNYFSFGDNNASIQNEKLFEHVFSRISPDMELLARVNTAQGLMVNTKSEFLDNRNMKICNSSNNCMYMNVNDDGFNITPDSIDNLTINSSKKTPLAKFDLENDSIYFGGDDLNSPLFIRDGNVFVNNINLITKPSDMIYDHNNINDVNVVSLSGHNFNNEMITTETLKFNKAVNVANNVVDSFIANYYLRELKYSSINITMSRIAFNVVSYFDCRRGESLMFEMPESAIGNFKGTTRGADNTDYKTMPETNEKYYINSEVVPAENISIRNENGKTDILIILNTEIPAKTIISFHMYGWEIFESTLSTKSLTGTIIGTRKSIGDTVAMTN